MFSLHILPLPLHTLSQGHKLMLSLDADEGNHELWSVQKDLELLPFTICKIPFLSILCITILFCATGRWEGMNKSVLQLNLYDLISCSCWDTLVLNVGMKPLLGESNQRVDCVALFSGHHLAFCCLL